MNISRVVTLSLALAVAVFALGSINPSFAHKTDKKHNHGGSGDDSTLPVGSCADDEELPCIVSVGKSLRPAAAAYAGIYTVMSSQRFGEILGTSTAAADLCAAFDVVIVEWSNPKIKNLTWPRFKEYMACGGGIIFEDPRNVEALASGVSILEINFKSRDDQPILITLVDVPVLTLGPPVIDIPPDCSTGSCNITVVNEHMKFNADGHDINLMPFLTLADGTGRVVGLYGTHVAGGIVLTGPDNSFHGNLIPIPSALPADNLARANMHKLLHNEITWLLSLQLP